MNKALMLRDTDESGRLSDSVYQALLESIIARRLAPGTIVSEVALARQLKVSRTPVHDALRQLAKDGLVQQRANHRAVIATFSREDLRDIFDMRKLLEGEAARLAATRIDRPNLARLRVAADALAKGQKKPDWLERWADFDEDFHATIAQSAGSPRLYQDIVRYRLLHRAFNTLTTTVEVLQQALEEHVRILDALEKRDAKEAARQMVSHIQEWQTYFVNHFPG
jgi:DNA-binding GntR family transcriptional regulator